MRTLSLFTTIHLNPDFPPGLEDSSFLLWSERGICTIGDLVADGTFKSFNQLTEQHDLPSKHLFRYLQIRSFVSSKARLYPGGLSHSSIEEVLQDPEPRKLINRFYNALSPPTEGTGLLKLHWEADLG